MQNAISIILAGGSSSRMKRDKACLMINGKTMLERANEIALKIAGNGNVFVSGKRPGYKYFEDEIPGLGPVEGLRSVCNSLPDKYEKYNVVVLPIDMPNLDFQMVTVLLDITKSADCAFFEDAYLPVAFSDLKNLKCQINYLCSDSKINGNPKKYFSIQELLGQFQDRKECRADLKYKLINTNTPEEWSEAISKTNNS